VKALAALALAILAAISLFEVTMRPSSGERSQLLFLFIAMAAGTALIGWLLPRVTNRFRSLRTSMLIMGMAAVGAVAVATGVAARLMFLESHDLQLLTVVLGFGVGLGVVLAITTAGELTQGLGEIGRTAARVADGDLDARTGVLRADELGAAAAAVDLMAERLSASEAERVANEKARRHFLAALGHDLRSPLAALRAAVEALEDGLAPDPQRYLRSMRADVDAMSHLVDDLFLLATIEAGKLEIDRELIDLAELADESIDALEPVAAGKGVELRLDAQGSVAAMGGATALGRVIRNLLNNAIRYSPESAEVVVRVRNGAGAMVAVADSGPGFSAAMVDEAFDEFVTADPARSRASDGAGLGLAIAKGIVAAHGGTIWAEPGPGGMVAFRIPSV
jgi:signal transduction histidine kinase